VGIKVNKLSSTKTQLPYEYYSLPFCKPTTIVNSAENLGEARAGACACVLRACAGRAGAALPGARRWRGAAAAQRLTRVRAACCCVHTRARRA
jgi:hypothetical protein